VTVPAVVGETASTAAAELQAAGLKAQTNDVASDQPKGAVVAQNPRGGEAVARGATVSLDVSRGAAPPTTTAATRPATTATTTAAAPTTTQATGTPTPALVGKGIVTALGMLERAGLLANVEYQSSQSPLGQVRSQNPRPGTRVASRTRVQVIVSDGPNPGTPTDVPDVTGQDQATARSTLEDAGFTVAVIQATVRRASTGQPGTVVEQQPAAGAAIAAGDYVVIYVSR
jgi:serine/threonine-protein kinase